MQLINYLFLFNYFMSSNTNLEFVKFVKNKKHAKPKDDDLYEIDFLGRKKEGVSFNDTIPNDVKKIKIKEGELSLSDLLSKNKNKIIVEPRKKENNEKNKKNKNDKKSDNEEEEELSNKGNDSYNESEDFEENINHYIGHKRENIGEMEEIIKEIKERSEGLNKRKINEDEEEFEEKKDKKEKKKKKKKKDKNNKKENKKEKENE